MRFRLLLPFALCFSIALTAPALEKPVAVQSTPELSPDGGDGTELNANTFGSSEDTHDVNKDKKPLALEPGYNPLHGPIADLTAKIDQDDKNLAEPGFKPQHTTQSQIYGCDLTKNTCKVCFAVRNCKEAAKDPHDDPFSRSGTACTRNNDQCLDWDDLNPEPVLDMTPNDLTFQTPPWYALCFQRLSMCAICRWEAKCIPDLPISTDRDTGRQQVCYGMEFYQFRTSKCIPYDQ